jgi:transposase
MKTTEVIDYTYIGVDVSKDKLDLYRSITKKSETITNEVESIEQFYQHLKTKGKLSKVAIVACMRKLLTILNFLIKSNQCWQTK